MTLYRKYTRALTFENVPLSCMLLHLFFFLALVSLSVGICSGGRNMCGGRDETEAGAQGRGDNEGYDESAVQKFSKVRALLHLLYHSVCTNFAEFSDKAYQQRLKVRKRKMYIK